MDDKSLFERSCSLRNLCFKKEKRFVHDELGFNYRMTNLQAAVGLAQLEKLDTFIEKKRMIGKFYTEQLQSLDCIQLPLFKTDYAQNIYWVYGIVLKEGVEFDAAEAMHKLSYKKIGTRPFFWSMHEQPVFKNMGLFQNESYPVAQKISRRGFYLPSGLALNLEQMERVVSSLKELL